MHAPPSLRAALVALGAWALVGCGSSDPGSSSGQDAGTLPGTDGGEVSASVEIGTGIDRFEPITEDQVLPLDVGPQGGGRFEGYHIYSAVKVRGYAHQNLLATFRILDDARDVQAEQSRNFRILQPDGDAYVAYAVAPRLMDCCVVEDQPIYLSVEVTDSNGLTGSDERRVRAGPLCEDPENPGTSLCP